MNFSIFDVFILDNIVIRSIKVGDAYRKYNFMFTIVNQINVFIIWQSIGSWGVLLIASELAYNIYIL